MPPKSIFFTYAPNDTSLTTLNLTCRLTLQQGNKSMNTLTHSHAQINHTHMHTQVHECWDMHVQTTWQYARAHCIRTPRLNGRQDPREHKTSSNEIQSCGHALYPIEMRLEKVQRSQLEFITGGRSTQIRAGTHPPTHPHTQRDQETAQKSVCSLICSKSGKSARSCRG